MLRPVFMNQLKLVDQKMIIIVLVLPYLLNLKKVELIPVTGDLLVFLSVLIVCLFFIIRKGKNSITIKDYLSSSLQFSSSCIAYKIRQYIL